MIKFDYDENFLYLRGVPTAEKSVMELYFNAVWSAPKKRWRLPLNRHVLREVWQTFPELRGNQHFSALGYAVQQDFNLAINDRKQAKNKIHVLDPALRLYQREDVEILLQFNAAGIFNEPRTGKTPTAICLMKRIGGNRNLVVCPASLLLNWKKEIETWWPEATPVVITGLTTLGEFSGIAEGGPAVAIVSKDLIKPRYKKMDEGKRVLNPDKSVICTVIKTIPFHTCFVDEAHFLRNYDSDQANTIFKLKAERRYAMTGTPTVNHPSDVWGILHFLYPETYTSFWQFAARYFDVFENEYSTSGGMKCGEPKPHREAELQELIGFISVQRKRTEVMPWLPKKQYTSLPVKMEGKQLTFYKQMKAWFTAYDEDTEHEVDAMTVLGQMTRMRQLCLDPRLVGFNVPGAKTKALLDYLENRREPVVIMSMFTSYLKMIAPDIEKIKRKVGFIHGEMSATQKQETINAFQAGHIDVLLGNIIACGVGHTLDRSNTVIFLDRAWTPAENSQAEDRICPTSENRNHAHLIIDIACTDSIDERINIVLSKKQSLIEYINEGGRDAVRRLIGG